MFLNKKWFGIWVVIAAVLMLGACEEEKESGQIVEPEIYDNPRNYTAEDFMPISEGFEDYSLWIVTSDNPERSSSISSLYVFKNDVVTYYFNILDKPRIEEINGLSDDEIIQIVSDKAMNKTEGNYHLDITLDRLGQYTENIKVVLENGSSVRTSELESVASEAYYHYELSKQYSTFDSYISALKTGEAKLPGDSEVEFEGDNVIFTKPIEGGEKIATLEPQVIQQTIFDVTYSGVRYDEYKSLLTRVDNSFVGFNLDGPDTKNKNVTIEGK